jgi:predicted lipoprotein with Yx(FWY)xxD motif
MIHIRTRYLALSVLALLGLLLAAGCGVSGGSSSTTTSTSDRGAESAGSREATRPPSDELVAEELAAHGENATTVAVVKTMATPKLGKAVVDSRGMTLYVFRRDNPMLYQFTRDPSPSCYDACTDVWSPLLSDARPKAVEGAQADLLDTIERRDGGVQVTYDGHPLYLYAKDVQPGDTKGHGAHGFGAEWHAVEGDGDEFSPEAE